MTNKELCQETQRYYKRTASKTVVKSFLSIRTKEKQLKLLTTEHQYLLETCWNICEYFGGDINNKDLVEKLAQEIKKEIRKQL